MFQTNVWRQIGKHLSLEERRICGAVGVSSLSGNRNSSPASLSSMIGLETTLGVVSISVEQGISGSRDPFSEGTVNS